MKVLSEKYPGALMICPGCQALLGYGPADIYEDKFIYCPICKEKIPTLMDLSYDGLKEELTT